MGLTLCGGGRAEDAEYHESDAVELLHKGHGSENYIAGNDVYERQNQHDEQDDSAEIIFEGVQELFHASPPLYRLLTGAFSASGGP